jgi:hypothetical protein
MVIIMMMKKRGHCSAGKAASTGETTMHEDEGGASADYDCATAVFSFAFSFVDYVFSWTWTWTFLMMFDSSWYFNSNGCFAASTEQIEHGDRCAMCGKRK